jgi:hypothetical protein
LMWIFLDPYWSCCGSHTKFRCCCCCCCCKCCCCNFCPCCCM